MSVIQIGDLVMIGEDSVFQVISTTEYKGENYLYGFKAPKEIEDAFDMENLARGFLKEIVEDETEECFVEEVEDLELVKLLTDQIVQEYGLQKK